jgi:transposase InsO family protein
MLREWAYAAIYASSRERTAALSGWLERYNTRRPHGSLNHKPPISRLTGTNLPGSYN